MSDLNRVLNQLSRNFSDWVREGSGNASEWWDHKSAIQKKLSRIRQLMRQRQETTVGIGAKVYSLHRKGKVRNTDLLADCEKVDDIAEQIEMVKREIEELRDRDSGVKPDEPEMTDESPVVDEEDKDTTVAVEVTVTTVADVVDAEEVGETEPDPDDADPGDGDCEDGENQ